MRTLRLTCYRQTVFRGLSIILQTHFHQTQGLTDVMEFRLFQDICAIIIYKLHRNSKQTEDDIVSSDISAWRKHVSLARAFSSSLSLSLSADVSVTLRENVRVEILLAQNQGYLCRNNNAGRFPQKLINIRGGLRESLLRYSPDALFFCLTKHGAELTKKVTPKLPNARRR